MKEFSRIALWRIALVLIGNIGLVFFAVGFALTPDDTQPSSTSDDPAGSVRGNAVGPYYTFGSKFEPPDGRVVHGMGQWEKDNEAYLKMLGDKGIYPLTELHLLELEIEPGRTWGRVIKKFKTFLARQKKAGRIPSINLGLSGARNVRWWELGVGNIFSIDILIVNSDAYDKRIREIANILRDFKKPVFITIGSEFNGRWSGYHPYDYPKAFRKIVNIFRERRADNVAFVWCYHPAAANDFDEKDSNGDYRWFPGDDVIDWFGLNVFEKKDFSESYPEFDEEKITRKGKAERFLKMAAHYKKPVMICQSSAIEIDAKSDNAWDEWFVPFFLFVESHPQIKAFVYICADWPRYKRGDPTGWRDSRIYLNPSTAEKYITEMKKGKYVHLGEVNLLKDYKK